MARPLSRMRQYRRVHGSKKLHRRGVDLRSSRTCRLRWTFGEGGRSETTRETREPRRRAKMYLQIESEVIGIAQGYRLTLRSLQRTGREEE